MPKITVSIPDELLKKFKKSHPDVNVAEVVRSGIKRKVEELKKFEELKRKGLI